MLTTFVDYILGWVQSFFAEFIILFLLLGLAFTLLGIFLVFNQINTQIQGQKIVGTIIGAVREVKVTIKGKKIVRKNLNYGTLWPVFEYTLADGTTRQDRGSIGGSHVYKYKTGQNISLIVYQKGNDFFVRGAKNYVAYVFGFSISIIGGGIIYYYFAALSPQFNSSTLIWLGAIVSLFLRYKNKIVKIINDYKDYKENGGVKKKISELERIFDPEQLHPIEYFVDEREQRRRNHNK